MHHRRLYLCAGVLGALLCVLMLGVLTSVLSHPVRYAPGNWHVYYPTVVPYTPSQPPGSACHRTQAFSCMER